MLLAEDNFNKKVFFYDNFYESKQKGEKMKLKKFVFKILSLMIMVAMLLSVCATTISAVEKTVSQREKTTINYVSIGDSMTNGYGFVGYEQDDDTGYYDFLAGENMYGEGSYALQFEEYLKTKYDEVNHTKLAPSALLVDDLLYLLGGREEEFNDYWGGYRDYVGIYYHEDEVLKNHFQTAVTEADVITLAIGNASFGAFLLDRIVNTFGVFGAPVSYPNLTLENALGLLESDEAKMILLEIYAALKEEARSLAGVAYDSYNLNAVLDIVAYTVASFLVNYEAVIDRIAELNPDVEIILVGIMNTTYGLEITGDGMSPLPIGEIMDSIFGILNAYMAGIPTLKQHSGKYADVTFYYVAYPNPEVIGQVFDNLSAINWGKIDCDDADCPECNQGLSCDEGRLNGRTVRTRNKDAYNHSLFPIIAPLFNSKLAEIGLSGGTLSVVDIKDIDAYKLDASGQFKVVADLMTQANSFNMLIEQAKLNPGTNDALLLTLASGDSVAIVHTLEDNGYPLLAQYYNAYKEFPSETEETIAKIMSLFADQITEELSVLMYLAIEEAVAKSVSTNSIKLEAILGLAGDDLFSPLGALEITDFRPQSIKTAIVDWLTATDFGISLCKIYALFQVGNGMAVHPTPSGHDALTKSIIEAYENKYTAHDETLKNLFMLRGELTLSEDTFYLAIVDGEEAYADIVVDALNLSTDQYKKVAMSEVTAEDIARASFITVAYNGSSALDFALAQGVGFASEYIDGEFRADLNAYIANAFKDILTDKGMDNVSNALNGALDVAISDLLGNATVTELDWVALVGEENLAYVNELRAVIAAALTEAGLPDTYSETVDVVALLWDNAEELGLSDLIANFKQSYFYDNLGDNAYYTINIPVREIIDLAVDSALYEFISYNKNYSKTMLAINALNPDATVAVLGSDNNFEVDPNLAFVGDAIVNNKFLNKMLGLSSIHPFAYATIFRNVYYVDISDAKVGGAEYIANQIVKGLSITCGHKFDNTCDADCNFECGYTRDELVHHDDNKDHLCDNCNTFLGDCVDENKDHKCDVCGATLSECADADKDHNCDYCGAELSKCDDADKDHKCDYCGAELSECDDVDKNHKCDYCGAELSKCDDADKDHKCDYCGAELSKCDDADKDHKCDYCGAELSKCDDADKDHKCDYCGAELSKCDDADKDHKCDYCGVELSKCDDADKNHKCDYCGAELSKCDDADKDHKCDYCGAEISKCDDADKDHKCDYCGAELSKCDDADKDHNCDYCGAELSKCDDADKDHKCDYCGVELSKCDDADKNHKCDYCGATLSECADADKDHKCDYCGATLSECADADKNHKCDLCDAVLSECADENKDHNCDYCGNTVSEHKWADATCKAPKTCEICGKTEGKVADHQYGDWETVKEATKKEEGEQKKTCKVCGDTVTEAIPMLEKSSAAPIITAVVIVVVAGLGTAFVVLKKKIF